MARVASGRTENSPKWSTTPLWRCTTGSPGGTTDIGVSNEEISVKPLAVRITSSILASPTCCTKGEADVTLHIARQTNEGRYLSQYLPDDRGAAAWLHEGDSLLGGLAPQLVERQLQSDVLHWHVANVLHYRPQASQVGHHLREGRVSDAFTLPTRTI